MLDARKRVCTIVLPIMQEEGTSNGQPDVEELEAGSVGQELIASQNRGIFWPATATLVVHVEPR
jgi:hypothetical protein